MARLTVGRCHGTLVAPAMVGRSGTAFRDIHGCRHEAALVCRGEDHRELCRGVTVCEVARHHGLALNQLISWRRQFRSPAKAKGTAPSVFVPVLLEPVI